ncbi:hypothetical protein F2Q69_00047902 [Brassica cretica]|uniref:Uncharacterized protein n=1 Tax=Brassica cretica TaxID=69181 RepID=A0A8S9PRK7_BRACR|nr:hypothetical protein F2Q69_00047902 [Brassica cretica]
MRREELKPIANTRAPDGDFKDLEISEQLRRSRNGCAKTVLAKEIKKGNDSSDESDSDEEESDGDDQFMLFDLYTLDICKAEQPKKMN